MYNSLGTSILGGSFLVFFVIMCWSIVWKAIALWLSARNNHKLWFGIMIIINTVGILEIVYIVFVAMKRPGAKNKLIDEIKYGGVTTEEKPKEPEVK